jgi:hypothetical protein
MRLAAHRCLPAAAEELQANADIKLDIPRVERMTMRSSVPPLQRKHTAASV